MAHNPFGPYTFKPTLFPVSGFGTDDGGENTDPNNVNAVKRQLKEANDKVATLQKELEGARNRAQDRFIKFRQANTRAERAEKTIDALKFDWEDRELKHKRALLDVKYTVGVLEEQVAKEKNDHEATKATLRATQEHITLIEKNVTIQKEKTERARQLAKQLEADVRVLQVDIQNVRRARDQWQSKCQMLLQSRQPTPTRRVQAVPLGSSPEQANKKRKLDNDVFTSMSPQRHNSTANGRFQRGILMPDGQNLQSPPRMGSLQPSTTARGSLGYPTPMTQNAIGSAQAQHQPHSSGTTWQTRMQSTTAPSTNMRTPAMQHTMAMSNLLANMEAQSRQAGSPLPQFSTQQNEIPVLGNGVQTTLNRTTMPTKQAQTAPVQAALSTPCINCRGHFWEGSCDNDEPCRNCTAMGWNCERKKCQHYDQEVCPKKKCKDVHPEGHFYKNLGEFKLGDRFVKKKKDAGPSPVEVALAAAAGQTAPAASSTTATTAASAGSVHGPIDVDGDKNGGPA